MSNAPVEVVKKLEAQYRLTLPDAYRRFLLDGEYVRCEGLGLASAVAAELHPKLSTEFWGRNVPELEPGFIIQLALDLSPSVAGSLRSEWMMGDGPGWSDGYAARQKWIGVGWAFPKIPVRSKRERETPKNKRPVVLVDFADATLPVWLWMPYLEPMALGAFATFIASLRPIDQKDLIPDDLLPPSEETPLDDLVAGFNDENAAWVRRALESGADANAGVFEDGNSLLHQSIKSGEQDLFAVALEHGGDPRAVNKKRQTPLHIAAFHKKLWAIQKLLALKVDVRAVDDAGNQAIHLTSPEHHGRNLEARQLLVAGGADPKAQNHVGKCVADLDRE